MVEKAVLDFFEIEGTMRAEMKGRAQVTVQEKRMVPRRRDDRGDKTGLKALYELSQLYHTQARRFKVMALRQRRIYESGAHQTKTTANMRFNADTMQASEDAAPRTSMRPGKSSKNQG